jgi:hypothetical protein
MCVLHLLRVTDYSGHARACYLLVTIQESTPPSRPFSPNGVEDGFSEISKVELPGGFHVTGRIHHLTIRPFFLPSFTQPRVTRVLGNRHTRSSMNLPFGSAGSKLSHPRRRTGDHKSIGARPPSLSTDTLARSYSLKAHLWRTVVQSHAKAQHTFRLYRNHYTCSDDLEPAHRGARRRDARTPARAHPLYELTTPRRSSSLPRWGRSRRSR